MINLDVHEYCQDCTEFEPLITQRPSQANIGCSDIIIECAYKKRCDNIHNYNNIYEYLKKEKVKIVVDDLPYYGKRCPFITACSDSFSNRCPRFWGKDEICSDDNPHECLFLVEKEKK